MNKIEKGFIDYRLNGGVANFNEWYNALLNKAYELDEQAVVDELNEDFEIMDNYYTELCEELKISFKEDKNGTDKKLNGTDLEKKYEVYKKKQKKAGKTVLSFSEWSEKQQLAKAAEKELRSAGIKVLGNTAVAIGGAAAAVAAHKVKEKGGIKTEKKQDAKFKEAKVNFEGRKRKFSLSAKTEYK